MSKRINDKCIKINGAKFKELLETTSGKTLKEISLENGFSDSFLRMVVKSGKATPTAQAVAKLYGIEPSAYEVKEAAPETPKQLSIDDLNSISADALKAIVKEAVREFIASMPCALVRGVTYDPLTKKFKLYVYEEDLK